MPVILCFTAGLIVPEIALAVLLISLAPAGVTSTGLLTKYGGNLNLAILVLLISSTLAPLSYSSIPKLFMPTSISLNSQKMLLELVIMIFFPLLLSVILKPQNKISNFICKYGSNISAYLVCLLLILAVSIQQEAFILNSRLILESLVLLILFSIYYLIGFFFDQKNSDQNLTLTIASGANNNALAITVGVSYYSATEVRFLVLSELVWFIGVMLIVKIVSSRKLI